ncbi:MAG: CDP-alcohol phosphatidyltransferase family protein [Nakamurella sp.]
MIAQLVLLAGLAGTVSLGPVGWAVGLGFGAITNIALARGLSRAGRCTLGPANRVTLARATLVGGVAALIADSFTRATPLSTLIALAAVALALDAVDGRVARRTGTVTPLGARFDMEVDAFLILVLSVYVAAELDSWWVLSIGAARYLFVAAGLLLPWLRRGLPPRYWGKLVAATQGVVLTVVAAGVLPRPVAAGALAVSLVLLAESFGRSVWWLREWRGLPPSAPPAERRVAAGSGRIGKGGRGGLRTAAAWSTTIGAGLLVWFALVAPDNLVEFTPAALLRIPVEGLVMLAVILLLPPLARRVTAALVGVILALLTLVRFLDLGFLMALDRPFEPLSDWRYAGSAVGLLSDSIGRPGAILLGLAAAVLVVVVLVAFPLAVLRLTRLASLHRTVSLRTVAAVGLVWVLCAILGVQIVRGAPVASASAAGLTIDQVREVRGRIADQQAFVAALKANPVGGFAPGDGAVGVPAGANLLGALRGKDVLIAFVESYGRVAVQDSAFSPGVDATLDAGTSRLARAGFAAKSAFLTSPTFGGISWLAHSTFQSGLWVDNQERYDELVGSDRMTLARAFSSAGWRTVGDVPSNERDWPAGSSFYHYDKIYDERNVGYLGPSFSYAAMPDQYVLAAFQRLELAPAPRGPVMAEIDLVSSHTPWAPLPSMVGWAQVGDGTIFADMPARGQSPEAIWQDPDQVKAAYGQSVEYSLDALTGFVTTYGDDHLVMIVLGDHQPAAIVSGAGADHDVPISIIARDPAVLQRISAWGWQAGLRPDAQAPVWPMDSFRDRFLAAFSSGPGR